MKIALALFLFSTTTASAASSAPTPAVDPNKQVTVTLVVQDWQAVVASVSDSARVSARDAARINQTIVSQVQPQIALAAKSQSEKK